MMRKKLNRKEVVAWYKSNRQSWIDSYLASNNPKIAFLCPICDEMGHATILSNFNDPGKYIIKYYCQECGFEINDNALERK